MADEGDLRGHVIVSDAISSARSAGGPGRGGGRREVVALLAMLAATAILSQFFRSSNSVIGPELIRDLSLSPEGLGFANGSFFAALLLAQVPVGALPSIASARASRSPSCRC